MKVFISLVCLVLLVVFASAADIDSLRTKFDTKVRGQCKQDVTTTTAATTAPTSTTASTTRAAPTTTPTTTPTTAVTPTTAATPTTKPTSSPTGSGRKKRDAQLLCVTEENKVTQANDVAEFHAMLKEFGTCQKEKCPTLNTDVDALLKESGATDVKVCGLLLFLMFGISFFG